LGELNARAESLDNEQKSISSVLENENAALMETSRLKRNLERELEKANKFLTTERKPKPSKDRTKTKLAGQLATAKAESDKLDRDIELLEDKKEELLDDLDKTQEEIAQQQQAIKKARSLQAQVAEQKAEARAALKAERKKTKMLAKKLDEEFKSEMDALHATYKAEINELEEAKRKNEKEDNEVFDRIAQLQAERKRLQTENAGKQNEIRVLEATIEEERKAKEEIESFGKKLAAKLVDASTRLGEDENLLKEKQHTRQTAEGEAKKTRKARQEKAGEHT